MDNNVYQQEDIQDIPNQNENDELLNNNNALYIREELNYSLKYTKITTSFAIIFLLKIIYYIYFHFSKNEDKFFFEYYLIINYNQFYRCLTRYFISYGFCHLAFELYLTYIMCYYYENMLGTIMTITIIFVSIILISFVNIGLLHIVKTMFQLSNRNHSLDIINEGGMTPLFFTLYSFYFSFEGNSNKIFFLLIIFVIKAKHSEFLLILVLIFFTPNNTAYGNFSGIITAYILFKFRKYFLPRIIWIKEIENVFKLYKLFPLYRFITEDNPIMKKILIEFDSKILMYFEEFEELENGQQMTELTLLESQTDINNRNQNNNNNSV